MDSYHHHNPYMRPPPPPQTPPSMTSDPNLYHHQQPPRPSNSWYSNQFQYHPPPSSSSPPPQHNQHWAPPPPPPQQHSSYPPPPPNPNNYPPSQPQQPPQQHSSYPPPPPNPNTYPPPQQPQPYHPLPPQHLSYPRLPYSSQDWANTNWSLHSGWEHQGHSNEEDWAARARAWASARSAMDNQHPQSQFTAIPRPEEHSHYPNQYSQPVESPYQDGQQTSFPAPGFQSYQAPAAPLRPLMVHQQEHASICSYSPEGHFTYPPKDGALRGDMGAAFSRHEVPSSSSVHQQEVPSSYSSVPGMEGSVEGRQLGHSLYPGDGRVVQREQAQFTDSNHSLDPMDQPLDFVPRSSLEIDPIIRSGYPDKLGSAVGTDSVVDVTSFHAWEAPAPVSPGMAYPPIAPTFPSALQHDPSMSVPPLPGQPAPMFGRGPNFQQAVPSVAPPVGLGATTFPVDGYGSSLVSERSKKAAVPNWLREEIIKKKVTITSSVPDHTKEGRQSTEDESIYNSSGKGDQADSRSMDSSKSTDEDDDEDYEEAQRVASINQEIKRVLTEVLLKVTDELFDEIATEVLNEDDATTDVADAENNAPSHKTSPSPVPTPKASVKLLVPMKGKESEPEDSSGESSSGLPGNVLGLANYASDDNEDEHQILSVPKSYNSADEDDHPQPKVGEHSRKLFHAEGGNGSSARAQDDHNTVASKPGDHKIDNKDLENGEAQRAQSKSAASFGKKGDSVTDDRKSPVVSDAPESLAKSKKTSVNSTDVPSKRPNSRKSRDVNSPDTNARRSHKHETRSSFGRDKERIDEKGEGPGRREDRHQKKDKAQDHNGSKERLKEQSGKQREKAKEFDSRKRSSCDDKDSKKERKAIDKDVSDKKREKAKDEKGDKSRHKSSSDRGRHKRRRSSSVSSRGKQSNESPVVSDGSVDNASEDSRSRKVHSKRRNLSPSPDRSRGRHVSKSPSSKRSQRRHSPYSSLDGSRGRRSRSRSPVPVCRHR